MSKRVRLIAAFLLLAYLGAPAATADPHLNPTIDPHYVTDDWGNYRR